MKTKEATKGYRLSKWAGILQARKESGLKIREFCNDAGIAEHQYYYWQKKLREEACDEIESSRSSVVGMAPPGFMEIKMPQLTSVLSPTSTDHSQLCVESPGVRITAGGEYPVDKLVVLLREVMQPC
jgi:hypothetical protein